MQGLYYIGSFTRMQLYFFEKSIQRNGETVYVAKYIGLGYGTKIPDEFVGENILIPMLTYSSSARYPFIRVFFSDLLVEDVYITHPTPFKKVNIRKEEEETILSHFFEYHNVTPF